MTRKSEGVNESIFLKYIYYFLLDWSIGVNIPSNIYYLYAIQTSFYLHSIDATFYMDPWRNDSIAMIIHHVITVFLLTFSVAVR